MKAPTSIRPENWLEQVFATPLQTRVLRMLLRNPAREWTERQLAAQLEEPPASVNKVVRRLYRMNLLYLRIIGRSHLVRPRDALAFMKVLHDLFDVEDKTLSQITTVLASKVGPGVACYLFGSTARATASVDSDVDILVVGPNHEAAEKAGVLVSKVLWHEFPMRTEVISLGREELRRPRFRVLLRNIRLEGRRLVGPELLVGAQ
jgi:predicted nucleotidyltransferase